MKGLEYSYSFRSSPLILFWQDAKLVVSHLWLLYRLVWPLKLFSSFTAGELAIKKPKNLLAIAECGLLTLFSIIAIVGTVTGFVLLLPATWIVLWVLGWIFIFYVSHGIGILGSYHDEGEKTIIVPSPGVGFGRGEKDQSHDDETWLFVNGICTSAIWAQSNVDLLSRLFGRRVLGIHNQTNGFFLDIAECLLQREFQYGTQDAVPLLYERVVQAVIKDSQKKVVIIAHSQGGIICSLVNDWLLADLSEIEIYTFACAANHFNSPTDANGRPLINIVEHYANEKDPVAHLGLLSWKRTDGEQNEAGKNKPRFAGQLFKRPGRTGHLLNQHYLESLDPQNDWPQTSLQGQSSNLWTYLDPARHQAAGQ